MLKTSRPPGVEGVEVKQNGDFWEPLREYPVTGFENVQVGVDSKSP